MKKYNEVFHFKCAVCFVPPAIPVGGKRNAKQPKSQASEVPERTEPQRRNPTRVASTRPSTVVPSARPVELYNVTRAAQRQKEKSYPKNPLYLEFDWGKLK
jgi:hypothetical protein